MTLFYASAVLHARIHILTAILALLGCGEVAAQSDQALSRTLFSWSRLPVNNLPTGTCRGVSNDALITAGGIYRAGADTLSLTDSVLVLTRDARGVFSANREFRLGRAVANAATASWNSYMLCIGGRDEAGLVDDVIRIGWDGRDLNISHLPPLPEPVTMVSVAVVSSRLYVAGGLKAGADSATMHSFRTLDLAASDAQWRLLPTWPGPTRYAAASAASGGAFYLFGGIRSDTLRQRRSPQYLSDAYRYTSSGGWERLADLPYAMVRASAVAYGPSHILLLGGENHWGREPPSSSQKRPIMAYHIITDTWTHMGQHPLDEITEPAVSWAGDVVLAGNLVQSDGIVRAEYRSTRLPARARFGIVNYLVLGAYCLILVGMGLYFARGRQTDTDYFLARRRIPWWAAGISIFGTQLSAITFMAIPAKAYATDWVYILGQGTIVLIAPVVICWYLPFFRRLGVTTAYEYLEKRFSLVVRLFGSLAFILLQLGRMGVVIFLPALALSAVTGMSIYATILLMGLLSTFYTALGGMEAVIWSDVLQVVVLLGGALLSLAIIAASVDGGVAGLVSTAASFDKFHMVTWSWDHTTTTAWVVIVGYMLSNLIPYTADQTVVQRYLTTPSERLAARSVLTNAALSIPAGLIFFGLGTALFVFYHVNPHSLEPALQTDAIFPLFIVQQLPPGIAGLLIAGIFAAAMSSLDSSINSVAAAAVHDFYRRMTPDSTPHSRLKLAKRLTIGLGILATAIGLLMATVEIESLFDLFLELLGLLGGSLAGLFALGIFTQRATAAGALAGAFTSAAILYLISAFTQIHFFLYAGIGIVTCFAVGYLVSLVLPSGPARLEGLTIYTQSTPRQ